MIAENFDHNIFSTVFTFLSKAARTREARREWEGLIGGKPKRCRSDFCIPAGNEGYGDTIADPARGAVWRGTVSYLAVQSEGHEWCFRAGRLLSALT